MPEALYPDIDTYRRSVFAPEDDLLRDLMPKAQEKGVPRISVNAESGKALHLLARAIGAKKILEFGALAGYSGIWLARALPKDGRFITLEVNPTHAAVTRANYQAAGLGDIAEVWEGKASELLPKAAAEAPFDLVFIDADKESYPTYLEFALQHVRPGGLIIADNADAHGRAHEVLEPDDSAKGIQTYNERVADNPRLCSTILPIGGWLAVSLVLPED